MKKTGEEVGTIKAYLWTFWKLTELEDLTTSGIEDVSWRHDRLYLKLHISLVRVISISMSKCILYQAIAFFPSQCRYLPLLCSRRFWLLYDQQLW
jgi:hypothetical protein